MTTRSPVPATRRYYRSDDGRLVAGVAGGLAEHLGVPVALIRAAFVLLAVAGGAGLLMYAAFWALVPQREGATQGRRGDIGQLVGYLLLGIAAEFLAHQIGLGVGPATSWPVYVAAAGGALIWRQADEAQRSRWVTSARTSWRPLAVSSPAGAVRLVVGAALVLAGLLGFLLAHGAYSQVRNASLAAVAVVAGIAVVIGPWLIRMVGDLAAERRERIRTQERAEIAARVHDSVLHTLGLDPAQPGRSSRGRAAGQGPGAGPAIVVVPPRYAGAVGPARRWPVERAAGEVEDSFGVSVDVVVVGDAVLDEALVGLVQAAREAMVNAAKSSGTQTMSVYVEVEGDTASAFVRDRGSGFDLDTVAADRYGIRQSIIGRMQRIGGTAQINTASRRGHRGGAERAGRQDLMSEARAAGRARRRPSTSSVPGCGRSCGAGRGGR